MAIYLKKVDENYIQVECEKSTGMEIHSQFSFFMDGFRFTPQFKFGNWDGQIHLFNLRNNTFPLGLLFDLIRYLKEHDEKVIIDKTLRLVDFSGVVDFFLETTLDDLELDPYDYQLDVFKSCIERNRALVLSPTSSGKSLIIYLLVKFFLEQSEDKILISVPKTNLVKQIHEDFCDYETTPTLCNECYEFSSGKHKETDKRIVIATWAMLYRQDPEWFKPFGVFICDEAHQASAPVFTKIIGKLAHVRYKFGFTGTLSGAKVHEMQVKSWFGSIVKSYNTAELMERGITSQLKIRCISLEHSPEDRMIIRKCDYKQEIDFLINHAGRNQFILDTALQQTNNTLILFNLLKHGECLSDMLIPLAINKQVFKITGEVGAEEREYIRHSMETNSNIILLATYGTLSMGVNIKNLHTIVFAHPFKARIRNLQSIGRGLRLAEGKTSCTLIDIGDNLTLKKHKNFTYNHFIHRMQIYENERFSYSFEIVNLCKQD
jgi:superfamily II DNA or RNA helicase